MSTCVGAVYDCTRADFGLGPDKPVDEDAAT